MTDAVRLPDGSSLTLRTADWASPSGGSAGPRLVYAAAHVVMRDDYAHVRHRADRPGRAEELAEHIDWDATGRFRRHLMSYGFGIAEAMDTAQRYEVGWSNARRLIELCGRLDPPAGFIAGAGTDHLTRPNSTADLVDAVVEQCGIIRGAGGWPMVLAMPWLSINRCDEATYVDVYTEIIRQAVGPLFLHWLGPVFLPSLSGYFPGESFQRIMDLDPSKVRGCKLSLLDDVMERRIRLRLAQRNQIMLTGDDFHFGQLMEGRADRSTNIEGRAAAVGDLSHGLLGVFDGIAAPAAAALYALGNGDVDEYRRIMRPCERYGRTVFEAPTQHYKVGLAFTAWLNGHQSNPMLPNHLEESRGTAHLCRVAHAANDCGALTNTAADRLARWARDSAAD